MKLVDCLTILAIFWGPIVALYIQRLLDAHREARERKVQVFRNLMTTRASRVSQPHVEALNMINVAFYGNAEKDKVVVAKWRGYLDHLNSGPQNSTAPNYQNEFTVWEKGIEPKLTDLLHSMGKALKFDFDPVDIKTGGYRPKGHNDLDSEQTIIRQGFVKLFEGKQSFPISIEGNNLLTGKKSTDS